MEKKKKGRVKEWLKENWPSLVVGSFYAGVVGITGYSIYKGYKYTKDMEAYWQTPEAWNKQADEYKLLAEQSKLMSDYYEKKSLDSQVKITEF